MRRWVAPSSAPRSGAGERRSTLRVASPGTNLVALGLVRTGGSLVALSVEIDLKDPFTIERAVSSRFGTGRGPIAAQTSDDGGATWSAPVTIALVGQASLIDAAAGDGLVAVAAPQVDGAAVVSGSHVAPFGPYNGADTDGGDVLVAFVADDDENGSTESRLARVR